MPVDVELDTLAGGEGLGEGDENLVLGRVAGGQALCGNYQLIFSILGNFFVSWEQKLYLDS